MIYNQMHIQTECHPGKIVIGLFLLYCGCCIYLLFRIETINLYQWCSKVGLFGFVNSLRYTVFGWPVPDFVKYSLPDGLYCSAYILLMDAIWDKHNGFVKYFFLSIVPVMSIVIEILQYYEVVKGTFDIYDLLCYSVPVLFYVFIKKRKCLTIKIL